MTTTTVAVSDSPAPNQVAPEGHDAAMAAKFDATQARASTTPELIGGKFKSVDDLLASYKALEAKLGAPKDPPAAPAVTTPVTPAAAKDGVVTEPPAVAGKDGLSIDPAKAAEAATAQAGLDMAALTAEYAEKGDLTEEAYAKLAAVGMSSKQMVADYADGQKVRAAQMRTSIFNDTGVKSEENFTSMIGWAATNLPKENIAAYNAAVAPGQPAGVQKLAVEAMFHRFTRAQGSDALIRSCSRAAPRRQSTATSTNSGSVEGRHARPALR